MKFASAVLVVFAVPIAVSRTSSRKSGEYRVMLTVLGLPKNRPTTDVMTDFCGVGVSVTEPLADPPVTETDFVVNPACKLMVFVPSVLCGIVKVRSTNLFKCLLLKSYEQLYCDLLPSSHPAHPALYAVVHTAMLVDAPPSITWEYNKTWTVLRLCA